MLVPRARPLLLAQGEWVANKYEGGGKYTWPQGTSYQGQWVDNVYAQHIFHHWQPFARDSRDRL